jgi:DNA-binding PadR family transcriptional regulator
MREEGIAAQSVMLNGKMKAVISRELKERIVKNFADIIILKALREEPLNGYAVILLIHRKFNILLSPGTIYSFLYQLERKKLLEASFYQNARCYRLTEKGEEFLKVVMAMQSGIKAFVSNLF